MIYQLKKTFNKSFIKPKNFQQVIYCNFIKNYNKTYNQDNPTIKEVIVKDEDIYEIMTDYINEDKYRIYY